MKKLLCFLTIVIFTALFGTFNTDAVVQNDELKSVRNKTKTLIEYIDNKDNKDFGKTYGIVNINGYSFPSVSIKSKENLTEHDNFDYHWNIHEACLIYNPSDKSIFMLTFIIKEYQEYLSPDARGFILYVIKNVKPATEKEFLTFMREYNIVGKNRIFIIPIYPDGYINKDWFSISKKEAFEKYKSTLEYWIKKIKTGESEKEKKKRVLDSLKGEEGC